MPLQIIQPRFQFIYNSLVASGYKVFTYTSGTSVKKTTWTTYTKTTPNTNPVVLDTQGMADIWLDGAYKIVVATPDASDPPVGAEIIYTVDNVIGYNLVDWTGLTASIADLNSTTTTIISKSGLYTVALLDRNKTILVDTTGGDVTINLLAAATALSSFNITIKKIDLSTNKVIIQPNGAETVDGQTPYHLYDYNDFVEIHSDASNWKKTSSQIRGTVRTITSVTTLTLDDNGKLINCDTTGGGFLVNLPANSDVGRGYKVTIKKIDSTSNAVTITPAGGELIDGASNLIENLQYGASSLESTGTGWSIYSEFGIGVKAPLQKDDMYGILISNGTDTLNDIDFHTGVCRDNADSDNLKISATITKQMDNNWVAGNNAGGRPTGVPYSNDTWYHCFVIAKPDGTTDAGFDTSVTATNLLANATGYTLFRRVGSIRTTAAPAAISLLQFVAREIGGFIREFWWTGAIPAAVNGVAAAGFAASPLPLPYIPANIVTQAILIGKVAFSTSAGGMFLVEPVIGVINGSQRVLCGSSAGGQGAMTFYVKTDGASPATVTHAGTGGGGNITITVFEAGWQEFVRLPS